MSTPTLQIKSLDDLIWSGVVRSSSTASLRSLDRQGLMQSKSSTMLPTTSLGNLRSNGIHSPASTTHLSHKSVPIPHSFSSSSFSGPTWGKDPIDSFPINERKSPLTPSSSMAPVYSMLSTPTVAPPFSNSTTKLVPLAPPPETEYIPLQLVSFGPLYHALHHPTIRDRLGVHYTNSIDLSLLGGILKSTMDPFTSLKLYLQAAQETGILRVHHQGSRCLLRVLDVTQLQRWASFSPDSVLVTGSSILPRSKSTSNVSTTPMDLSPPIPLSPRELAPFVPLLHAYCAARTRYPPPIRTPAIGPLLKPFFVRGELAPWRKLSEYLVDAERIRLVTLTRLGVNGDVEIEINETVSQAVWSTIRAQYDVFREPDSMESSVTEEIIDSENQLKESHPATFQGGQVIDISTAMSLLDETGPGVEDEEEDEPLTFTVRTTTSQGLH